MSGIRVVGIASILIALAVSAVYLWVHEVYKPSASLSCPLLTEMFAPETLSLLKDRGDSIVLKKLAVDDVKKDIKSFNFSTSSVIFKVPTENPHQYGGVAFRWEKSPHQKSLTLLEKHDFSTLFKGVIADSLLHYVNNPRCIELSSRVTQYFNDVSDEDLFNTVAEGQFVGMPSDMAQIFSLTRVAVLTTGTSSVSIARGTNQNGVKLAVAIQNDSKSGIIHIFKDNTEVLSIFYNRYLTSDEVNYLLQSISYQ